MIFSQLMMRIQKIKKCQYELSTSREVIIQEVIMIELRDVLLTST